MQKSQIVLRDRFREEPDSDLTTEDFTQIFEGITERLADDPEAARFEDLDITVRAEFLEIEAAAAKAGLLDEPDKNFSEPLVMKYNSLKYCKSALEKLTSKKKSKKKVSATSEEGQALLDYLTVKRKFV